MTTTGAQRTHPTRGRHPDRTVLDPRRPRRPRPTLTPDRRPRPLVGRTPSTKTCRPRPLTTWGPSVVVGRSSVDSKGRTPVRPEVGIVVPRRRPQPLPSPVSRSLHYTSLLIPGLVSRTFFVPSILYDPILSTVTLVSGPTHTLPLRVFRVFLKSLWSLKSESHPLVPFLPVRPPPPDPTPPPSYVPSIPSDSSTSVSASTLFPTPRDTLGVPRVPDLTSSIYSPRFRPCSTQLVPYTGQEVLHLRFWYADLLVPFHHDHDLSRRVPRPGRAGGWGPSLAIMWTVRGRGVTGRKVKG